VAAALSACTSTPTAPRVAEAILYDANKRPVRPAFNAALASRFPVGSSLNALTNFMTSIGGTCASNVDGIHYRCWADIEPCSNTIVSYVEAKGDVITNIKNLELALKSCSGAPNKSLERTRGR